MKSLKYLDDILDILGIPGIGKAIAIVIGLVWLCCLVIFIRTIVHRNENGTWKREALGWFCASWIISLVFGVLLDGFPDSISTAVYGTIIVILSFCLWIAPLYGLYCLVKMIFSSGNRMFWLRKTGESFGVLILIMIVATILDGVYHWLIVP